MAGPAPIAVLLLFVVVLFAVLAVATVAGRREPSSRTLPLPVAQARARRCRGSTVGVAASVVVVINAAAGIWTRHALRGEVRRPRPTGPVRGVALAARTLPERDVRPVGRAVPR